MENTPESEAKKDTFGKGNIKNIKRERLLGEGAYGVVYRGKNEETGETIALKKIKLET